MNNKWVLLFILAFTWGTSFILIRKGLETFNFMQLGALRLVVAGLFLFPLAFKNFKIIPKKTWIWVILSGLCGNFIPMFLFPIAEEHISSSLAGVLNSLVPLFVVILGFLLFQIKNTQRQIIGTVIGLIGAVFLIIFKDFQQDISLQNISHQVHQVFSGNSQMGYSLYIVLATMLYATSVLIVKKHLSEIPSFPLSTVIFGMLFIPSLLILVFSGFFDLVHEPNFYSGLGYVAILGIFGTALAMILFYKLIQMASSVFASSVTYIMPIFAVLWGVVFNEPVTLFLIIGGMIILFGVYLIKEKLK